MNWKSGLKLLGGIAGTIHPGVGAAISVVNSFLPDEKKLPIDATGDQVIERYESLPADQQAMASKRLDTELGMEREHTAQIQAAFAHDNTNNSTRPYIALQSVRVVAFLTIAYMVQRFWGEDVFTWQEILAMCAPFVLWANTYMNARKAEKIARYNVASGHPAVSGLAALVQQFRK